MTVVRSCAENGLVFVSEDEGREAERGSSSVDLRGDAMLDGWDANDTGLQL